MTKKLILTLFVTLLLLAAVGCNANPPEQGDSSAETPAVEVKRQIELYGTVNVAQSRDISLDKTVQVLEVYVKEGQSVAAGDALFSVKLDNLRRDAALLKTKIEVAEKQLEEGNYDFKKANVNVAKLVDKLADAEKSLAQNRALLEAGAISQRDFDSSAQLVGDLKNSLAAARYDVDNVADKDDRFAQSKIVEIAEYRRQYDQIMALLDSSLLVDNVVVSPLDRAVVNKLRLTPGAYLNAFTVALSLEDLTNLVIEANVIEEQIGSLSAGQSVTIEPIINPDLALNGTIQFISSRAKIVNNETVIPIEIKPEDNAILMPNLNVDIVVPLEDK